MAPQTSNDVSISLCNVICFNNGCLMAPHRRIYPIITVLNQLNSL